MNVLQIEQRSPEWYAARCGSLGSSQIFDMIKKTKSGYSTARANLMAELIAERLTGVPTPSFISAAMQHGIDCEADARAAYELETAHKIEPAGLVRHPRLAGAHASPDGFVTDLNGEVGLIEIKCPLTATHLASLRTGEIDARYVTQMQWQLACTGLSWCDFVSFDPRLPGPMQLFIRRWQRDEEDIDILQAEAQGFLDELGNSLEDLRRRYSLPTATAEAV